LKSPTIVLALTSLFMMAACDDRQSVQQMKHEGQTRRADVVWVEVAAIDGGTRQSVEFDEQLNAQTIEEARQQVASAGYGCNSIQRLWLIKATMKTGATILKVTCSGDTEYQLTLFDGKGFVKPWTGVLMGT
jgi:hypothetical protein